MASRSLTEVFILMRNNAIRNRHIYAEQVSFDEKYVTAFVNNINCRIIPNVCL